MQIAKVSNLKLEYHGTLGFAKWISLIDQTLNGNYPCGSGAVAAAGNSTQHSGPVQASSGTKIATIDTTGLDTAKVFAVCYTDAVGDISATWIDTGIRLTVAKILTLTYDWPLRVMVSSNVPAATNKLPQVASTIFTYAGELVASKWLSSEGAF